MQRSKSKLTTFSRREKKREELVKIGFYGICDDRFTDQYSDLCRPKRSTEQQKPNNKRLSTNDVTIEGLARILSILFLIPFVAPVGVGDLGSNHGRTARNAYVPGVGLRIMSGYMDSFRGFLRQGEVTSEIGVGVHVGLTMS